MKREDAIDVESTAFGVWMRSGYRERIGPAGIHPLDGAVVDRALLDRVELDGGSTAKDRSRGAIRPEQAGSEECGLIGFASQVVRALAAVSGSYGLGESRESDPR